MRRAPRAPALAALALVVGCGDRKSQPPAPTVDDPTVRASTPPAAPAEPPRTAPHPTAIIAVTLDRTGTAAVTVDGLGGVRLWPTLDGTREPAALPFHGPVALDLAAADDGFVVGAIDPSGAPHLVSVDARGGVRGAIEIPAVPPAAGLVALGADAWLVVRTDQSIELYDRRARRLADVARDGTRIDALRADAADRAVALVTTRTAAAERREALTLTVAGGRLVWGAAIELPVVPASPAELALSPDGTRLAYLVPTPPDDDQPPPPDDDRPFDALVAGPPMAVVVVDRATGADVTPAILRGQALAGARRLGFVDDRTLVAAAPTGELWTAGPRPDRALAHDELSLTAVPAISGGRRVGALGAALALIDARQARYLGYQAIGASGAALSPSGARVAWLTPHHDLLIEPRDRSQPPVRPAVGQVEWCGFIDEETLLVIQPTQASVVRAGDGQVVATVDTLAAGVAPVRSAIRWNPRTGWIAWVGRPAGVWTGRLTGATFTAIHPLPDGADALLLEPTDDDAPALIAVDQDGQARTFSGRELAAGVTPDQLAARPHHAGNATLIAASSTGAVARYDGSLTRASALTAAAIPASTWLAGISQAAFVPGADRLVVIGGATGVLSALDPAGGLAWRVTVGAAARELRMRADGREAVVVTDAGAVIVDLATGAIGDRRCGWLFGEWAMPPDPPELTTATVCE